MLVGASLGGIFVRLYAHTYPDEVVGLVLVDASHEDQDERLRGEFAPEVMAEVRRLDTEEGDPEGIWTAEGLDVNFAQMRDARRARPLRPIPLVVIAAGIINDLVPFGYPAEYSAVWQNRLARELQEDLASLVPSGRLVVAEQSGHFPHEEQPSVVIAAIRDVVGAVREPSTWATPTAATPLAAR